MFQNKLHIFSVLVVLIGVSCSSPSKITKEEIENTDNSNEKIELNLDVKRYSLDNGLRILVYENKRLPIYSYYTFFDVGGRFEDKGLYGGTHYLEHMMFKGAKKYSAGKMDVIIEGFGGRTNAYTSRDLTVYYEHMPKGTLDTICDIEADRLNNLLLEKESFEKERQVILDERLRNYDTDPKSKLFQETLKQIFKGTPYARSVIGMNEDIKGIKRNDMMKYFKTHYAPNNAVIVVAGDVDADEVYKKIKKYYSKISLSKVLSEYKRKIEKNVSYKFRKDFRKDVKLNGINPYPIFVLAYKGHPMGKRKGFSMDILSSVLGDGQSSYLNKLFVTAKRPMLQNISVGNYTLKKSGVFYITGQLLPGKNIIKLKRNMLKQVKRFCINKKQNLKRAVQKVKNNYLLHYINELKTNSGIAHFIGLRENFFGDYQYYKKEWEIYESIKTEEVQDICKEVFNKNEYLFLSIWKNHPQAKRNRR